MPNTHEVNDIDSIFSNNEGDSFTFSLTHLEALVSQALGQPCQLRKLAEGGFHKIYDILLNGEDEATSVVRVAAPDFPVDKLTSEVATLKYISRKTFIRVPRVIAWNANPSNAAGAEFMILEKIDGVPAHTVWDTLTMKAKESMVRQVATSLLALFRLRFSKSGSLYLENATSFEVGPIVSMPFFQVIDGERRFPSAEPLNLSQFRGPFTRTSEYLSSMVHTESFILKERREKVLAELDGDDDWLIFGERILNKAARLAKVYPGDIAVGLDSSISDINRPFSLKLDDFRLANIMIEEQSGTITGLIDFESTTISPLWMCAELPWWLHEMLDGSSSEKEERAHLRAVFSEEMANRGKEGREWLAAAEQGEHFRYFAKKLTEPVREWARKMKERWIDARLAFAKQFPGVGLRELTMEESIEAMRLEVEKAAREGVVYTEYA